MMCKRRFFAFVPPALLVLTMVLYMILIPPFQNPDEVQHFAGILTNLYPQEEFVRLEKELLYFLWETKWFVYVGIGQPDRPPAGFHEIAFINDVMGSFGAVGRGSSFFHTAYALLLRPFKWLDLHRLFFLARFLSLLFSLLTLSLIYSFLRGRLEGVEEWTLWPLLMIPQLLVAGTAVNYDILAVLFGTLFFPALFHLKDRFSWAWLVLLLLGLFGSLFSKKGGWLFFLFLALGVVLGRFNRRRFVHFGLVVSLVFVVFSWVNYLLPGKMFALYQYLFSGINRLYEPMCQSDLTFGLFPFGLVIFKSFFATIGWMVFEIGSLWYVVFFLFCAAAAWGWFRDRRENHKLDEFIFIALVIGGQFAATWQYYGERGVLAQGRYFFPLSILFFYILVTGLRALDRRAFQKREIFFKAFMVFNILANLYLILGQVIPLFYLSFSSPYQGL
ncbi:MAG TPA: hypothetical protein ENN40_03705 [Candidatus Aminicenantes bacterium]|nr:hypothetical protein [Candidatus Aminicenantes bacterium]